MRVRIVAPIRFLKFEGINTYNCMHFKISNDKNIIMTLLSNPHFAQNIGGIKYGVLLRHPFFYYEGTLSEFGIITDGLTINDIGGHFNLLLSTVINNLWYLKDNSAFVYECFVMNIDSNESTYVESNTLYTSSNGESAYMTVNSEVMLSCIDIFNQRLKFISYEKVIPTVPPTEISETSIQRNDSDFFYSTSNRIQRAVLFLQTARSSIHLIRKITGYIAIYECLFTSNSSEVVHQVSERAALFIGGDQETKMKTYTLIKKAYAIRSKYVHGLKIKNTMEQLIEIVTPLDDVTRILFNMVFDNSEVFLLPESEKSIEFDNYFKTLIFS